MQPSEGQSRSLVSRTALRFVVLIGVLSFFADFTYEGSRSIVGPFLASLQANAFIVGVVSGLGELLGYGLRLVSGPLADRTRRFWPITIFGYVVQMTSVPLLALAGNWPAAAALIVLERVGKAIRNPPRDVMLSHAATRMGGYGWTFGLHEALDQAGAMLGPLAVAGALALRGSYRVAFAALAVPAAINLGLVVTARLLYAHPESLDAHPPAAPADGIPRLFWIYLCGAALVAAGFADYSLMAFHFAATSTVSAQYVPVFYAVAMGLSGASSLVLGKLFDRLGFSVLIVLTLGTALFAPLSFLGKAGGALAGVALWGIGMGAHESIIPAAVAPMVARDKRATAYGLFMAGYGVAWFLGSAALGYLYDVSRPALVAVSVALQAAVVPFFIAVARRRAGRPTAADR